MRVLSFVFVLCVFFNVSSGMAQDDAITKKLEDVAERFFLSIVESKEKDAFQEFDKLGVTGSSPVSPILYFTASNGAIDIVFRMW